MIEQQRYFGYHFCLSICPGTMITFTLLVCASLFAVGSSQKVLPVGTIYTTPDVQRFAPKAQHVFVASTCGNFNGFDVSVGIMLFHNPDWRISQGVVRFYVTDFEPSSGMAIPASSILCKNEAFPGAQPEPNCTATNWDGTKKKLYVVTTNGNVGGIDFSVLVEFKDSKQNVLTYSKGFIPPSGFVQEVVYANTAPTYLAQTVKTEGTFSLLYQENLLLEFAFCPDEGTTKHYEIISTIFGTGIHSAFNQYLCKTLPCNPDSPNVINSNPNEVALNTAAMVTTIGDISKVYVSVYGWGGDYETTSRSFRGHFQYGASLNRI